jgi:hypothetical protein
MCDGRAPMQMLGSHPAPIPNPSRFSGRHGGRRQPLLNHKPLRNGRMGWWEFVRPRGASREGPAARRGRTKARMPGAVKQASRAGGALRPGGEERARRARSRSGGPAARRRERTAPRRTGRGKRSGAGKPRAGAEHVGRILRPGGKETALDLRPARWRGDGIRDTLAGEKQLGAACGPEGGERPRSG